MCVNYLSDVPLNNLTFDSNTDENDIRQGAEVHLVCDIKANPWITTIGWHHNVGSMTV